MKPTANPNIETSHCEHEDYEAADVLNDTAVSESKSSNPVSLRLGFPIYQ